MASTREAHGAALHQVDPHLKSFESFLDEATAPGPNRQLAGVAAVAVDKTGTTPMLTCLPIPCSRIQGIIYAHTAGTLSVDASSPLASQPFTLDTTMWIASVTKLLTSISALQLVEKDLIGLDDDVGDILPFLKQVQILLGFDDAGVPQYKPKTKPITLRHLLTHSSGIGYAEFYPLLAREDEYRRRVRDVTVQTQVIPLPLQRQTQASLPTPGRIPGYVDYVRAGHELEIRREHGLGWVGSHEDHGTLTRRVHERAHFWPAGHELNLLPAHA